MRAQLLGFRVELLPDGEVVRCHPRNTVKEYKWNSEIETEINRSLIPQEMTSEDDFAAIMYLALALYLPERVFVNEEEGSALSSLWLRSDPIRLL